MEGIQQMFSALMGYDEYDVQLSLWAYRRGIEVRQADRGYKARNREADRQQSRAYYREHRAEILASKKANAEKHVEATRRWRERNREALRAKERERWHQRKAA